MNRAHLSVVGCPLSVALCAMLFCLFFLWPYALSPEPCALINTDHRHGNVLSQPSTFSLTCFLIYIDTQSRFLLYSSRLLSSPLPAFAESRQLRLADESAKITADKWGKGIRRGCVGKAAKSRVYC